MIKVGVIGVGSIGQHHARIYAGLEGVSLAGIADTDPGRGQAISTKFGSVWYQDYTRMLAAKNLDAVSVTVPTSLHDRVARDVINSGLSLLVEKPLASTVAQCQELISLAQRRSVKLAVGHVERFNPVIRVLKERIQWGDLGQIYALHARRKGPLPARVQDAGVAIDLATHDVDVIRYLHGRSVVNVYAETAQRIHSRHEDLLFGLLRFEDGALAVLDVDWLSPIKIRELTVTGEHGMFIANYLNQELIFLPKDSFDAQSGKTFSADEAIASGKARLLPVPKEEPLALELQNFIHAVTNGEDPLVNGQEGLEAVCLVQALLQSSASRTSLDMKRIRPEMSASPGPEH